MVLFSTRTILIITMNHFCLVDQLLGLSGSPSSHLMILGSLLLLDGGISLSSRGGCVLVFTHVLELWSWDTTMSATEISSFGLSLTG